MNFSYTPLGLLLGFVTDPHTIVHHRLNVNIGAVIVRDLELPRAQPPHVHRLQARSNAIPIVEDIAAKL